MPFLVILSSPLDLIFPHISHVWGATCFIILSIGKLPAILIEPVMLALLGKQWKGINDLFLTCFQLSESSIFHHRLQWHSRHLERCRSCGPPSLGRWWIFGDVYCMRHHTFHSLLSLRCNNHAPKKCYIKWSHVVSWQWYICCTYHAFWGALGHSSCHHHNEGGEWIHVSHTDAAILHVSAYIEEFLHWPWHSILIACEGRLQLH